MNILKPSINSVYIYIYIEIERERDIDMDIDIDIDIHIRNCYVRLFKWDCYYTMVREMR